MVDLNTVNFNFKLWKRATERRNLPLPPCKQIIPLAHLSWNRGKPGGDINTQLMWEQNFPAPVHSPQNVLVKTMLILQPVQAIHRLSCIIKGGDENLDEFFDVMAWRKKISRDQPVWRSTRSIDRDLVTMSRRHDPARPLRSADAPSPIVIRNPEGVRGINAVVQGIGMAAQLSERIIT